MQLRCATRSALAGARPVQHRRASVVAMASSKQQQQEPVRMHPLMMAVMLAVSGGLIAGPIVSPPAARADEGTEKRKAETARRKAILAASRAKAEEGLATPKQGTEVADAEVERKNAERRRLAAERAAAVEAQRNEEYNKQAARAVQTPPPV